MNLSFTSTIHMSRIKYTKVNAEEMLPPA